MKKNYILSLLIFILIGSNSFANNYYFSNLSGDDNRSSIEAQNINTPWKSVNKLNAIIKNLNPGDSVLFKRGEVFTGLIVINKSGTATQPIVFSAYGTGNKPIFTLPPLTGWIKTNGVYSLKMHLWPLFSIFYEDGKPLQKQATSASCSDGVWFCDSWNLYYKPATGSVTNHTITIGNLGNTGYEVGWDISDCSYLTIDGLEFDAFGTAIQTFDTNKGTVGLTIQNSSFNYDQHAIVLMPDSGNNTNATVKNCYFFRNQCAINMYTTEGSGGIIGQAHGTNINCKIINNEFAENGTIDGIIHWNHGSDYEAIGLQNFMNGTISNNYIHDGFQIGIIFYNLVSRSSDNNVISYNKIFNNKKGGLALCGDNSDEGMSGDYTFNNNYISNNLFVNSAYTTNDDGTINIFQGAKTTKMNYFVNNTLVGNLSNIAFLTSRSPFFTIENNIFYNTGKYRFLSWLFKTKPATLVLDYNLYYESSQSSSGFILGYDYDFKNFRLLGLEKHGRVADPQFLNVANDDYHLKSGSPAIDSGINVGLPYVGAAPDIGAFEFQSCNITKPNISTTGSICIGATLKLTANGQTGVTYNWIGPNGFSSTQQNPVINNITSLQAGTYSVTSSLNGCASTAATTIIAVNDVPAAPSVSNIGSVCTGGNLTLKANGQTGVTYNWIGPNGFSSTQQNPVINNITSLQAGTYSVTSSLNGCASSAATTIIAVNDVPAAPSVSNIGAVCTGANLTLKANGQTGVTYNWIGPNGFSSTQQNPVINNITSLQAGTYSVTSSLNGCASTAAATFIAVNDVPAAPSVSNIGAVCTGANLTLKANGQTGVTYNWIGPNGFLSTEQNPILTNITTLQAGTYSVTSSLNGCASNASTTNVTVNEIPPTPSASNNGSVCAGAILKLNANGQTGVTYNWSGPNGFLSTEQNPILTNITTLQAGTYSVTGSLNGCASNASTTIVTVNNIPTTPLASNNGAVCAGSMIVLKANGQTGVTYNWNGPNGFSSTEQNPVINNVTTLQSGTYNVTASFNGCTSNAATCIVIINEVPSTPSASNNGAVCSGSTLKLNANGQTGVTYMWNGPNGFSSVEQNPIISNITRSQGGIYAVTASNNGCTSINASTMVIVNETPVVPLLSNNGPICSGSSVNLTASGTPNATYSWTGPNGFTSNEQNPILLNSTTLQGGTYSVTSFLNGCSATKATTSVIINPTPSTPAVSNNGPVTTGSILKLFASDDAGVTYNWSGPNGFLSNDQNPHINNVSSAQSGSYSVVATLNGCSSNISNTTVIVNPLPIKPIIIPTIKILDPVNNANYFTNSKINITTGSIAGSDSGSIIKVNLIMNDSIIATSVIAPFNFILNNLPEGNYTIIAKATNNYGNSNVSLPVNFKVNFKNYWPNINKGGIDSTISFIKLSPVPATTNLHVTINNPVSKGNMRLTILDINAREIKNINVKGNNFNDNISIDELHAASYILRIQTENKVVNKIFIKQ